MSTKINVRSPYYVRVPITSTSPTLHYTNFQLYVWTGDVSSVPASANYSFTKYEIADSNYIVFEISEYIKDFMEVSFTGAYSSENVWVKYAYQTYNAAGDYIGNFILSPPSVGYYGYGYFEEGVNPQLSQGLLISNNVIYRRVDYNVRVPVDSDITNSVAFYLDGELKRSQTVTTSVNSDEQILYLAVSGSGSSSGNDDLDNYEARILADGGTFEDSQCLRDFMNLLDIGLVDELRVYTDSGVEVVSIESICEPKFTPHKVTFVNKFGALQDMWFFKKSITNLGTTSESYKANIMNFDSAPTYSTSSPQYQVFNKQGRENIRCSTGFIDEQYNEVIKQLMLSEQVWIDNGTNVLPVAVASNSLEFKKGVNDKLIDYTLEFQYAFDKINSIR